MYSCIILSKFTVFYLKQCNIIVPYPWQVEKEEVGTKREFADRDKEMPKLF